MDIEKVNDYREYVAYKAEIEANAHKMDKFKEAFANELKNNGTNIEKDIFEPVKECWFKRFLKKLNNTCS